MIILTDKAKKDFGRWHFERRTSVAEFQNFDKLSETAQYAVIIEWFDSVGIYLQVGSYNNNPNRQFAFYIVNFDGSNPNFDCGFSNRIETTKEAITVANEIYNER
jgi:hypothetical protein